MTWTPYNPSWLVLLAQEQHPEEAWLPRALADCTLCQYSGDAYIYFVEPMNANTSGAEWQFERNILLHSVEKGLIALDILRGNRVGGVEFYKKLSKQ